MYKELSIGFKQGVQAFIEGLPLDSNPHRRLLRNRITSMQWEGGWHHAQQTSYVIEESVKAFDAIEDPTDVLTEALEDSLESYHGSSE